MRKRSRNHRAIGGRLLVACAAVAALTVAGVLGQRQYVRAITQDGWVAARALPAGHVVTLADLTQGRVGDRASSQLLAQPGDIVGKRLTVAKNEGESFAPTDLENPDQPWMSTMAPDGRVVFALEPDKHLLPYSRQLRRGDRFDILVTHPGGRVHPLAFDAIMLGILKGDKGAEQEPRGRGLLTVLASPEASSNEDKAGGGHLLVLAVKPEHVVPLASARGSAGRISFVVHGQKEVQEGRRLTVVPPTHSVELYSGLQRTRITLTP